MRYDKFLRITTIQPNATEKKRDFCGIDNISALKRERKERQTNLNKLLAHNTRLCALAG
jgi:hypothetical protein